ncbi:MAG TPA: F0F1 ATP synthase subunit delta [Gammaproteobacteria bacterium]|nr:F0F1 ATP synthase subunit delta [Gammaproteobacteria bacterium]
MTQANKPEAETGGESELARPYARAVFELAREKGELDTWSARLALMGAVASDEKLHRLLDDPRLTRKDKAGLMIRVCGEEVGEQGANLLRVLAENGRLDQLPMIERLFRQYRDEAAGTLQVDVISALPLAEAQKAGIAEALKKRLGRDVQLNCSVNEDLVGGAVIRAGDLVIDGSAVEHLQQLANALVH